MAKRINIGAFLFLLLCIIICLELKATELMAMYQVDISEPDGENGYYKVAPEIRIKHLDSACITKYQLNLPNGEKVKGELTYQGAEEKIDPEGLMQGENVVYFWAERAGEIIGGSEKTYCVMLDSCAPNGVLDFSYQVVKENVLVEINASDTGSGIREVRYQIENGSEMTIKDGHGFITVPKRDRVILSAYAIDHAGNIGSVQMFECDFSKSENQQNRVVYNQQNQVVNEEKTEVDITEEEQAAEDEDTAGENQVIDRNSPEILKMENLNGQKLKEFQWDYELEDVIKDDSAFVYEIRLDGSLWDCKEKSLPPGLHVLEIWARDSSGNESSKRAEFEIIGDEQEKNSHKKGGSQVILRFLACIMKKFYLKVFKYFVGVFFC